MRSTTTATHAGFYGRRAGFAGYLVEVAPSGEALFGSISHAAVFSALEDAAAVAGSIPNGTIAERLAIGGNFGGNFGARHIDCTLAAYVVQNGEDPDFHWCDGCDRETAEHDLDESRGLCTECLERRL